MTEAPNTANGEDQISDLERAREQQAATQRILEIISNSRDDEGPVFQAIAQSAERLCRSPMTLLMLLSEDQKEWRLAAHAGEMTREISVGSTWEVGPEHAPYRSVIQQRVIQEEDLKETDYYKSGDPDALQIVDGEGIRSRVCVPLLSGGKGVGVLVLCRRAIIQYDQADLDLAASFAAQAVIAIENTRQFRELQMRLEREAATGEVLGVITTSRDDEKPVFDTILENTARLCETDLATLNLINAEGTHLEYAAHHGRTLSTYQVGVDRWSLESTLQIAQSVREGRVVHNVDLRETDLYIQGDRWRRQLADDEGVRSFLTVPLISAEGQPVGCIGIYRKEVRAFTESEISLVETFAAQAVIAIENVRQFRDVQERLEREQATSDVLSVISQSRDDEHPVFETILKNAMRLCEADMAVVNTANEDLTEVRYAAGINSDGPEYAPGRDSWPIDSDMFVCRAIRENRTFHTVDLKDTDLYRQGDPTRRNLVDNEGMLTQLVLPLTRGDTAIASFSLYRRRVQPFSDGEIALLQTFAAQAVIAIENVRQFRDVQTRLEREAATRQVLETISVSRDDDAPVFGEILDRVSRLCQAPLAFLSILSDDGTKLTIPAHRGAGARMTEVWDTMVESMEGSGLVSAHAIRSGEVIHVPDLSDDPTFDMSDVRRSELVELEGVRSYLVVPLRSGARTIGTISLYRREVQPFTTGQIELAETFAAQAVIAIENVRQFRELQNRLEREAATKEVLQVISQSRDDENPVFDVILKNAAQLCRSPHAGLHLADEAGENWVLAAIWGDQNRDDAIGDSFRIDAELPASRAIAEQRCVQITDLAEHDLYQQRKPIWVKLVEERGMRTLMAVPLMRGDTAIGSISLYRREVEPFPEDEIALVQTFAAQAVIAMESVRQFRELQERLEREKATSDVLSVISRSRDDELPVFQAIHESASRLCDAPFSGLFLVDESGECLDLVSHFGGNPEYIEASNIKWRLTKPAAVTNSVVNREVVHVHDVMETDAYREGDEAALHAVELEGTRTFLAVPMLTADGAIGTIGLYRREVRPFTDEQIAIVQTFAAQAVIAIENVRQFRELQDRLEREQAGAEILEVISQSRADPTAVFQIILKNALKLCRAPQASLSLVSEDSTQLVPAAREGHVADPDQTFVRTGVPLDQPGMRTTAIREKRTIHVDDVRETEFYKEGEPNIRALADVLGARTALAVPLISGNAGVGVVLIYRNEIKAFTTEEVALVETFAAQAAIAIENTRQFRELQTRLQRETATGDVLNVISRSRDDDQPVFNVILENAARLCQSTMARLHLVDDDRKHRRLAAHWGEDLRALSIGEKMPMDLGHPISISILDARVFHIEDISETDLYKNDDPLFRRLVDEEGIRTLLTVPLLRDGTGFGCIAMSRKEKKPFAEQDIDLIKTFAAQAVIAIENVQQFREVQERLEREAATRQVLQVVSRSRDDELPVFDAILECASRLCDAPLAYVCMATADRTEVFCPARRGAFEKFGETLQNLRAPLADSRLALARAINECQVFREDDIAEHELYRTGEPNRVSMVENEGARSLLVVPLVKDGVGIGSITLYRREVAPFSDDDVGLVEAFAAQAVIAIENVRQFNALETLNAELGERVDEQVGEIERMGRLKRFLPSAVADAVVTTGDESMLSSHRALIATLFCDMRGFTAFCEAAEPEETIDVLQTYHQEMSELIDQYGGGVDQRAGDGIMVIFNDPIPVDDPAGDAVRLALAMREKMRELCAQWKKLGHRLGFGIGIAFGYATVGMVGSAGRFDYTASGTSVNTAARLCDMAAHDEILISPRTWVAVEGEVQAESRGEVEMKGIREPVEVFAVIAD